MIKVKITKNIIQEDSYIFGLTLKQIIMGIVGFALGGIELWLLFDKIDINILMSIVFITILIFIAVGVVKIQGMSLIKLMFLVFKGVDKRPFNKEGVFSNENKNPF